MMTITTNNSSSVNPALLPFIPDFLQLTRVIDPECRGRQEYEFPFRILALPLKFPVGIGEATGLDRLILRQAVYAHDAAVGGRNRPPLRFAGQRIGINLPQMPQRHQEAVVL